MMVYLDESALNQKEQCEIIFFTLHLAKADFPLNSLINAAINAVSLPKGVLINLIGNVRIKMLYSYVMPRNGPKPNQFSFLCCSCTTVPIESKCKFNFCNFLIWI